MTSDPYREYRCARVMGWFWIGSIVLSTIAIIMVIVVLAMEVHKRGLKPMLDELWYGPTVEVPDELK